MGTDYDVVDGIFGDLGLSTVVGEFPFEHYFIYCNIVGSFVLNGSRLFVYFTNGLGDGKTYTYGDLGVMEFELCEPDSVWRLVEWALEVLVGANVNVSADLVFE